MSKDQDKLKAAMIDRIYNGGAWFCTRSGNYLKIAYAEPDSCLYARECIVEDGAVRGGAYTFGTDWFDISFHGRWIDIYADPDTLKSWEVIYKENGSMDFIPADGRSNPPAKLEAFCAQADSEALSGEPGSFHIDGAAFTQFMTPSEERMGKRESILSKVDTGILK